MRDYYAVLGVDEHAGPSELRQAYLLRAQILHPDRHRDAPPAVKAEAEHAMAELNEAWALLGNDAERRRYDANRKSTAPQSPNGGNDFDARLKQTAVQTLKWLDEAINLGAMEMREAGAPHDTVIAVGDLVAKWGREALPTVFGKYCADLEKSAAQRRMCFDALSIAVDEMPTKLEASETSTKLVLWVVALVWYAQRSLLRSQGTANAGLRRWSLCGSSAPHEPNDTAAPSQWAATLVQPVPNDREANDTARRPNAKPLGTQSSQTGAVACRYCGQSPAVKGTFNSVTGMVILMRFGTIEGPFCATCADSAFGRVQRRTALTGWFGVLSFIATPFVLLSNALLLAKARRVERRSLSAGHSR